MRKGYCDQIQLYDGDSLPVNHELNIYNTLTCKNELFQSAKSKCVKMFTCGPSTYQRAHIGNYRTFLFEDILQRYLEHLGYTVTRLMALTDVEDKAIIQAKKEALSVEQLTRKNEDIFFEDFKLLRIKKPDFPVRASFAVDQAVILISKLLDSGYAYWYRYKGVKNAYFNPLKFKDFGKLAHLDLKKWPKAKRRFHKDTYSGTPWNMGDFILWHGCGLNGVCYETAIGRGRPAWNIQDAAIVTKNLGFTIDIACGGIDNLVRHHDYTIAIAEAVSKKQFSRYWLHGEHLFVDEKKMSKSLGNVYNTSDMLAKGFTGAELRFFLIYGHYRKKLNFTYEKLKDTSKRLQSLRCMIAQLQAEKSTEQLIKAGDVARDFESYMNDDLDVKGAFDSLYQKVEEIQKSQPVTSEKTKNMLSDLRRIDCVLQCIF